MTGNCFLQEMVSSGNGFLEIPMVYPIPALVCQQSQEEAEWTTHPELSGNRVSLQEKKQKLAVLFQSQTGVLTYI